MSKRVIVLLIVVLLIVNLAGCSSAGKETTTPDDAGANDVNDEEVIELNLDHVTTAESVNGRVAEEYSRLVSEKTDGKVKINVFHQGGLSGGNGQTEIELLTAGSIDIILPTSGYFGNTVPESLLISLPFFYNNIDDLNKVLDSETGKQVEEKFQEKEMKVLAWFPRTARQISNSKKLVKTPEDMKSMKIRVMDSQIYIDTMKELGAQPTPMAWGEVYTALQLNTIDAQENPVDIIKNEKIYEVQKYITLWDYSFDSLMLIANNDKFNSLSPQIQEKMLQAAQEVRVFQRDIIDKESNEYLDFFQEEGLEVYTLSDAEKAEFRTRVENIWEKYSDQIGENIIKDARTILEE